MKINIDIDEKHEETSITIHANKWTDELEDLMKKLGQQTPKRIVGFDEDRSILLSPQEIDYIYAEKRKVFASVNKKSYEINMKLYEIEALLNRYGFTRLSKSVIGNLHQMTHFELFFNGTLCVFFRSGSKEYVSRKYVRTLKNKLVIGADEHGN